MEWVVICALANYFNLRNITFGYTFPKQWLGNSGISKLRIYFSGDNIWLRSARKGFDPRMNDTNGDGSAAFAGHSGYGYSALSTYSIGVNLSF